MTGTGASSDDSEIHLAGWTIVRVAGDLDADGATELAAHLGPALTAGANVVVDLRHARLDPVAGLAVMQQFVARAGEVGARLMTVEADRGKREALRDAGVPQVYESLDAAMDVTTATLRRAEEGSPVPPIAPAAGDAFRVATQDLSAADAATPD